MSAWGVLILSHGRAGNVKTARMLENASFKGDWRIVIDNQDDQGEEYVRRYGGRVISFCKEEYAAKTQTVAPTSDRSMKAVVYARNAAPDIAKSLGWDYFIELDDDYNRFEYRYVEDGKLKCRKITDLDGMFGAMVRFLERTGTDVIALAQGGDYIGGVGSTGANTTFLRKVMNTYAFRTSTDLRFTGVINEDLTMSILEGSRGKLMLTCTTVGVTQTQTQKAAGGLTDEYLRHGTWAKSMYSVVCMPSCCEVKMMGATHWRAHHRVRWDNACPKVIREQGRNA